jgi:hypothetical protein
MWPGFEPAVGDGEKLVGPGDGERLPGPGDGLGKGEGEWCWTVSGAGGGDGGSGFLLRRRIKKTPKAMRARTATPPTAPPTMAPTGVEEPEEAGGVSLVVAPPVWDGVVVEERRVGVEVSDRTVRSNVRPIWPGYVVTAIWAVDTGREWQK